VAAPPARGASTSQTELLLLFLCGLLLLHRHWVITSLP